MAIQIFINLSISYESGEDEIVRKTFYEQDGVFDCLHLVRYENRFEHEINALFLISS